MDYHYTEEESMCTFDGDCPEELVCNNGQCVAPPNETDRPSNAALAAGAVAVGGVVAYVMRR